MAPMFNGVCPIYNDGEAENTDVLLYGDVDINPLEELLIDELISVEAGCVISTISVKI